MRSSVNNMSNSFRNCPKLNFVDFTQESDLSSVGTIDGCFYGDSSLVSISNMKLTNPSTVATNITLTDCPLSETEGLLINSNSALDMFRMGSNSKISKITDFNLGENADDLHDLCMDYPLLISDFVIPTNVKNVSNTFKNCTSIETVTTNWTTLYDMNKDNNLLNDVITTDCYSGCVNAKYINTDLYVDEYGLPTVLKNIPTEWGGELSFSENKTAFDIKITEENLTYSLVGNVGDAKTNWGDGTEDMNITHTYSKPGIYIISTENVKTFATGSVIDPSYSSPIVRFRQLSSSLTKGSHLFDGWTNLIKIDGINHTLDSYYYLCNNCTSLTNDIPFPPEATNVERAFYNCSNLLYATSNWEKSYNGQITTTECYTGCNAISHFDGENILAYKGDSGIDYIPSKWGGYGFDEISDYYGIYVVNIPSDNYTFTCQGDQTSKCFNTSSTGASNRVNWGDGTIDIRIGDGHTHTYAKAGKYYIKGNIVNGKNGQPFKDIITKIIRHPKIITNGHCSYWTGSKKLTYIDVTNFNPSKGRNTLAGFLSGCSSLTNEGLIGFENLDVSNVTSFGNMFTGCSKLTAPPITTFGRPNSSQSIYYGGMYESTNFVIDNNIVWKIKGKCSLYRMFTLCHNAKEFNVIWETDEKVDVTGLFVDTKNVVSSLKTMNLTSCGSTIFKGYFFGGISTQENKALTSVECTGTQSYSLNLSFYPNLSKQSLLNIINCLCTTTETLPLTLGSVNLAKLSADEIKIATDKGWSVIA